MKHAEAAPSGPAANPLELPTVLAAILRHLPADERRRFRSLGTIMPRGEESVAEGAAPDVWFIASTARQAANEAVRVARVR